MLAGYNHEQSQRTISRARLATTPQATASMAIGESSNIFASMVRVNQGDNTVNSKYELTTETRNGLFRIRAKISFGTVKAGDLGGFIASEANLSAYGNAWVFDNARVSGNACVFDNARVFGNGRVSGDARVYGDGRLSGNGRLSGDAQVYGNARVLGDARVSGDAQLLVLGPIGSRKAFLSIYADAKIELRFTTGCFSGSRAEFAAAVKETHKTGTLYRKQYDAALVMAKIVKGAK